MDGLWALGQGSPMGKGHHAEGGDPRQGLRQTRVSQGYNFPLEGCLPRWGGGGEESGGQGEGATWFFHDFLTG